MYQKSNNSVPIIIYEEMLSTSIRSAQLGADVPVTLLENDDIII